MCDEGKNASTGMFSNGTFRLREGDTGLGGFSTLGTFSRYAVVAERATLCGDSNRLYDIPRLLGLHRTGRLARIPVV